MIELLIDGWIVESSLLNVIGLHFGKSHFRVSFGENQSILRFESVAFPGKFLRIKVRASMNLSGSQLIDFAIRTTRSTVEVEASSVTSK